MLLFFELNKSMASNLFLNFIVTYMFLQELIHNNIKTISFFCISKSNQ